MPKGEESFKSHFSGYQNKKMIFLINFRSGQISPQLYEIKKFLCQIQLVYLMTQIQSNPFNPTHIQSNLSQNPIQNPHKSCYKQKPKKDTVDEESEQTRQKGKKKKVLI